MKQKRSDPFLAIADSNRRQILLLLSKNSMTINALAKNFDMSRPAVSKHIKVLDNAGFISIEDIGRERYCVLNQGGFTDVQDWIDHFDSFWKTKLKMLRMVLEKKAASRG
jgi:DNA-binding transcriptional ArsR family regulator